LRLPCYPDLHLSHQILCLEIENNHRNSFSKMVSEEVSTSRRKSETSNSTIPKTRCTIPPLLLSLSNVLSLSKDLRLFLSYISHRLTNNIS